MCHLLCDCDLRHKRKAACRPFLAVRLGWSAPQNRAFVHERWSAEFAQADDAIGASRVSLTAPMRRRPVSSGAGRGSRCD